MLPSPQPTPTPTCPTSDGIHGGDHSPLVPLGVVTLSRIKAVRPIKAPDSIEQAIENSHAHPDSPRQHWGHQVPLIPLGLIPAKGIIEMVTTVIMATFLVHL